MKNALLTILIFFWKLITIFPIKFQNVMSFFIGRLILKSSFKRNKYSRVNIDLCFPDLSFEKRSEIYKNNILSSGQAIFDTGIAWFWSDERIKKNISYEIIGLENLLQYQKSNTGILLFFKHSLHLELDSRLLAMHAEIYAIGRKHNSKIFEAVQRKGRLKSIKGLADRKNTFTFIKWLKKGKTVLYASDQDYGINKSEEVDFFGLPSATISAPYKIVQKTGCKTFFINTFREDNIIKIVIEEINIDKSSSKKFSKELNKYIENKIRLNPHEYLWQHRRFKSTLGKKNIYK